MQEHKIDDSGGDVESEKRIDAMFRNGSVTAIGIMLGFSLGFLSQWASNPIAWSKVDIASALPIIVGIILQVKAFTNLLSMNLSACLTMSAVGRSCGWALACGGRYRRCHYDRHSRFGTPHAGSLTPGSRDLPQCRRLACTNIFPNRAKHQWGNRTSAPEGIAELPGMTAVVIGAGGVILGLNPLRRLACPAGDSLRPGCRRSVRDSAAGNVVSGAGPIVKGSITYGVVALGAPLVMVLGHSQCGAVKASLETKDPGLPESIRDLVRMVNTGGDKDLDRAVVATIFRRSRPEAEPPLVGFELLRGYPALVFPTIR